MYQCQRTAPESDTAMAFESEYALALDDAKRDSEEEIASLRTARWQLIDTAIEAAERNDGWIPRCLFAIKRVWGWEVWVGQCDAGDIWLGRQGDGSCFDCERPTHWMPIPSLPDDDT
jgi:hypothetical protein